MPRQSYLLSRNGRYYLNMRVPTELRTLYGNKEFCRKALGTSDHREAAQLVKFEAYKQEAEFAEKRRELAKTAKRTISEISEMEAFNMVFRWFKEREKQSDEWWHNDGINLPDEHRKELWQDMQLDAESYSCGTESYEAVDGSGALDVFLKREGIECPKDSSAYRFLRPLFRRACLENVRRTIDRMTGEPVRAHEPLFGEVFAHSQIQPVRVAITLGELLRRFDEMLVEFKRADVTRRTYEIPARVLREVLGEQTPLHAITKEKIGELFRLLRRAPTNATKRFPGLTLKEAIAVADRQGDASRLRSKTLENYFVNISAIFNFAVENEWLKSNPAKGRYMREAITSDMEDRRKVLFTVEELNRLFRAPLYTGCENDKNAFAKIGGEHPRRGRFWVPLLSLFHGFRCNEAAQLYTEDVCEENGIRFFEIRSERANGSKCDKRLKTKQSKRRVPIHPEIIRAGFLDFVAERRHDTSHPRLFPDLKRGASGYFSDPFSKWFGRFLNSALGKKCEATFHSFRHNFRDALREAGVPTPDVEALGGWEIREHSAERDYGSGPSLKRLHEQIEKVKYPCLDLSHLYAEQPIAPACRVRKRSRPRGV